MSEKKGQEATLPVPSGDRKKDQEKEQKEKTENKDKKKKDQKEEEMSEEDLQKKAELELLVERVHDKDPGVQKFALETLVSEIKSSTSSMTSVPKPLKFLRSHYEKLAQFFETMQAGHNKELLSDVLSVLAMTMHKANVRNVLKYKLSGSKSALATWGHEYVRSLAGEIGQEYAQRREEDKPVDDLMKLVDEIVPHDMSHNAEHEACDLLLEVEKIEKVIPHCDPVNYPRVCLYLTQCSNYVAEPEDTNLLKVVLQIYKKFGSWFNALRIALKMGDSEEIQSIFRSASTPNERKQLAILLGRQHIWNVGDIEGSEADLMNNTQLSEYFLALGHDLKITEAKTPEDVYKSELSETKGYSANIDSARQNLASTFVNAFVNCGFGSDKLMSEEGNKWIFKNKDHGMMAASASLGMILLWDVDGGLTRIDKYLYANEDYVKAGALLSFGIVSANVRNEFDPVLALLSEYVENKSATLRVGALLGLGLAYTGSAREDLSSLLTPILENTNNSLEVLGAAALALGMIFVGTANSDLSQAFAEALMELDSKENALNSPHARYLALGLGLLYLGKQETCELTLEALKTLKHPIGKYASLTVETCAYSGTGNVLKIQKLLSVCGDHLDEKANNQFQTVAVLGIALIAMGEEIGVEMAIRSFDHLLQYGDPVVRRGIPLALGLLSISHPRIQVMDTLNKLSHDADDEVSFGAIFALGLIGAGTNNSRVAGLLRGLATYYYKEPNHLFLVRIAQGLVFMGKGTLTLSPFHSDRLLLSNVCMTGLLAVIHSCFDFKNIILGKHPHMLYCLANAISPRMLMTFDEDMKPLAVSVRVGQAVDTVGQAGRPKTITGFQTHTTPVLLGFNDRAELATEEYISLSPVLEGFVILRKNPNYKPEEEETKKK